MQLDAAYSPHNLIERYAEMIVEKNRTINLTAIVDPSQVSLLHIEDSLVGLPEVNSAKDGPLVDLGTGGGFPGVPLSIMTERPTLLVDSRSKKADAIRSIIKQLEIPHTDVYAGRIEELSLDTSRKFAVATARALAPLPSLLELAAPLLEMGGVLVAYKAPCALGDEEEFSHAQVLSQKLGMFLKSWRRTLLSDGATEREIICFEKKSEPRVSLPRRPGMAQKKPY